MFDPTDDIDPTLIYGWKVCCTFDQDGNIDEMFVDQVDIEEYYLDGDEVYFFEGDQLIRITHGKSALTSYEGHESTFEWDVIYVRCTQAQAIAAAKLDLE
jgi:hypothetical protein